MFHAVREACCIAELPIENEDRPEYHDCLHSIFPSRECAEKNFTPVKASFQRHPSGDCNYSRGKTLLVAEEVINSLQGIRNLRAEVQIQNVLQEALEFDR